jgi:hypothetical protein
MSAANILNSPINAAPAITTPYASGGGAPPLGVYLPLAGGTMDVFPAGVINAHTIVGPAGGILLLDAGALGDVNVQASGGNASLTGDSANVSAANGVDINSTGGGPIGIDTTGQVLVGSILPPSSISMTSTGNVDFTTGGTVGVIGGNLDLNTNDLINGGNLGAESMVLQSNLAKAEFKNAAGVLKGSMGYNVGTDYMDLTGEAGFEIATTAGPINIQPIGGKFIVVTDGENIELAANTSGLGVFADVVISTSDGDLDIGIGGNIIMNAGTTGGNITVTAFNDFSLSSTTVKLPTLPTASTEYQLFYDISTKDVTYGAAFPAITIQAATGTIALTASMNRSTYILTGTSATQSFSQAGLVGVAAGWCIYLRNGNNATGLIQDITISIPAGSVILHAPTGTTNSSFILLYWNGSALASYR